MKKHELIELLKRSHEHLEKVTDRVGCSLATAIVLTDCENALNEILKTQKPKQVLKVESIVH